MHGGRSRLNFGHSTSGFPGFACDAIESGEVNTSHENYSSEGEIVVARSCQKLLAANRDDRQVLGMNWERKARIEIEVR
jgi:hypothetical protein